jgi:hypothetical protein
MRAGWFPVGSVFFVSVVKSLRFQLPPVKPCVRFSRTRLTDVVHRRHSPQGPEGSGCGDGSVKVDQAELVGEA